MTPMRWAIVGGLALLAAGAAVAVALLNRPGQLVAQPVDSVPPLLSEPAGIPGAGLTLLPTGLGPVAFGIDEADAIAELTDLLGEPVGDSPQPCEDEGPPARWVRWGDLTATFANDTFTGWIIGVYFPPDSPALRVETEDGVSSGAPVADLLAAYGARLEWIETDRPPIGEPVEAFGIDGYSPEAPTASGLGGFVEGGRETGRVITLIAGLPCGS